MSAVRGLPEVRIEVAGSPLAPMDLRGLGSVRVCQGLSLPSQCELLFEDARGPVAARRWAPGSALRVSLGASSEPLFSGEVTAVEYVHAAGGVLQVRVRGYDVLHRLRKRQPVRAHVQVTLGDLARELVSDLGLSVEAATTGPLWRHLIQHGQSDLDFLVGLAERCGVYLALREGVLRLLTLEGEGPPVPLRLGESLLEATLELNGDASCRTVTAAGWDALRAEHHRAQVTRARLGREVEARVEPSLLHVPGERSLVNESAEGPTHVEAVAQGELDHRAAREVLFHGLAEGDARLRPGARVEVRGVASAVAGQYVLTAVTHRLDTHQGFVSELSSEPPARRARAHATSLTLGEVSRVDDPERLGRVRVTLPALGGVETDWLQVLGVGAGKGKGLVALPDVGDQVLLALAHEDASRGVVVGGLYGMDGPHDAGVEGGAVRRYTLLTPGGHRLRLDDEGRSLRLEDAAGSFLEMTPERVRLHARAALELEAPGQPVVIRGRSIDFQRE